MRGTWTVFRWALIVSRRSFRHDFLHTLQGQITTVCLLLCLPGLIKLIWVGPSEMSGLSELERDGALFWAQSSLLLAFALTVALALLKTFIIKPENGTVWVFPFILRDIALYNFLVPSFLGASLFIVATFYVFFARLLVSTGGWAAVLVHFVLTMTQLFTLSVLLGGVLRRFAKAKGTPKNATLAVRLAVIPWMLIYAQLVAGASLVKEWRPSLLPALGSRSFEPWLVTQPSLAVLRGLSGGSWVPAVVSMTVLSLLTVVSVWLLARWYRVAHREIILDGGSVQTPLYSSAFAPGRRRVPFAPGSVSGAFWVKDVLLPIRRSAAGYAQQLAFTLSGSIVTVVFLHFWEESRTTGSGVTCFVLVLATLAVPLLFSAHGCLPVLGMEGVNIALLRPALGVRRLFIAKSSAQALFVLGHAAVLATLIGIGARWTGLAHPGILVALGLALAATVGFSAMGLALGFGLPDFHRRSMMLPGASKAAQFIHMAGGGMVAVTWSLLATAFTLGHITILTLAVGVIMPLALVMTLSVAFGFWSLRQLERLEI
jgi:hypothetical protein